MRKKPQRSCIACRTSGEKRELIRFVRTEEGKVFYDASGRRAGRGAYLCKEQQCFDKARKNHLLDRALKVKLDNDDYDRLEGDLKEQSHEVGKV
jgi:predicted RNA-binding protein YlxR (DUF448 family)